MNQADADENRDRLTHVGLLDHIGLFEAVGLFDRPGELVERQKGQLALTGAST